VRRHFHQCFNRVIRLCWQSRRVLCVAPQNRLLSRHLSIEFRAWCAKKAIPTAIYIERFWWLIEMFTPKKYPVNMFHRMEFMAQFLSRFNLLRYHHMNAKDINFFFDRLFLWKSIDFLLFFSSSPVQNSWIGSSAQGQHSDSMLCNLYLIDLTPVPSSPSRSLPHFV
jgi:hypothetical protein